MAVGSVDTQPGRELLQRVAGQFGCSDLRQQPRVKRARPYPRQTGQIAFALEYRKIEPHRVPDHNRLTEKPVDAWPDVHEQRRFCDDGVVDAMNARSLGGDRFIGWPQQLTERAAVNQLSSREAHAGKFDHTRLARIKPSGFGINDNGVERQKRGGANRSVHRPSITPRGRSKNYAVGPAINARPNAVVSIRATNSSWM